MINFSKTNWFTASPKILAWGLTMLLIVFIIAVGFFAYQWRQVKEELARQIGQNENLMKRADELQKEIEELKVSKKITDETTEWKTYRNENQGFEIKLPQGWKYYIRIDEERDVFPAPSFMGRFEESDNLWLLVKINMFTETTPALPPTPWCRDVGEFTVLETKVLQGIFSTSKKEGEGKECEKSLLDSHLVYGRFCIDRNKELKVYDARVGISVGEYSFFCDEGGFVYDFQLFCEGTEWKGKQGKEKCVQLFNKILSTFQFIEK